MGKGVPQSGRRMRPPSAHELARYGHVAAAISGAMQAKGLTAASLGRLINPTSTNPAAIPHPWINGKGAPSRNARAKVAKVLGLAADAITPLPPDATPAEAAAVHAGVPALAMAAVKARTPDVLTFTVEAGGMARLRLDVTLPVAAAVPLLRMILDAGLVLSVEG
jgi:hypothetical protein